jgi:hypothetical protein
MSVAKKPYPGDAANVSQLLQLANEYCRAAHSLLTTNNSSTSHFAAPGRMLAIHAIELYLNVYLLHVGLRADEIRGMQHDLSARGDLVVVKGLKLRKLTEAHLNNLAGNREYLVLRYDPGWKASASQINRLTATLDEIAKKVVQKVNA